jgi:hypothetical protein
MKFDDIIPCCAIAAYPGNRYLALLPRPETPALEISHRKMRTQNALLTILNVPPLFLAPINADQEKQTPAEKREKQGLTTPTPTKATA